MSDETNPATATPWRDELPTMTAHLVTLREPVAGDATALGDLLSLGDASRFGLEDAVTDASVLALIDRTARDRRAGSGFSYVVITPSARELVGLVQVRALDPAFETAEWECTLAPSVRGSGIFLEAARLVGSFVFESIGAYRLEARAPLHHGRANGALRKLGAVQEGLLRQSARRGGDYVDQVLWSVLKDDWTGHRIAAGTRVH